MAPTTEAAKERPQLPPRENALFKRVVKAYEHKQYKSGLKFCKQILSTQKFAEHGETLAMKGLILNCMGRRDEASELVKRGLRNDLKSHVCWHVYGLVARSEKKYDEAMKAYRNALKWDKDNSQILRDLCLLQVQMRDLEGYKETRYQLFVLRPSQRASWIGYAMALHLAKDYDLTIRVLEEFRRTQPRTGLVDQEHSEFLLYQNLVYRDAGRFSEAKMHLNEYESMIHDRTSVLEVRADLAVKLGQPNEAMEIYKQLIDRSPENVNYYRRVEDLMGPESKLEWYAQMKERYPRAMAPCRLQLNLATGLHFRQLIDDYLRQALRKGVPPLFMSLRGLYKNDEKRRCIEELMNSYLENIRQRGRLSTNENEPEESETILLWIYYYLAHHYDMFEQWPQALSYINRAIDHTPTLIEAFMAKARIYRHAGNALEAVRWMDEAQSLDTADRYINSKCAKYMLRANLIADAEMMCAKFTREGVNPIDNLNEMQCMWFEIECAKALKRLGRLGETLKKCHEVERHFADIVEDQFDFHTYCVRKMTLCSYMSLISLEDVLRRHPFYYKAAKCAIKIYLRLYDKPYNAEHEKENVTDEVTAEQKKQRRKDMKKAKKAEAAKEQQKQAAEKQQQHLKAKLQKDREDEDAPQQIESLDPDKLVQTKTPLDEAKTFFDPLMQLNCDNVDAYTLGFEIFYRKGKLLPMLHCLRKAHNLDSTYWALHVCRVKFLLFLAKNPPANQIVREVMETVLQEIELPSSARDPYELNRACAAQYSTDLLHRLAIAQSMYLLDPAQQAKAVQFVTDLDAATQCCSWKASKKILTRLQDSLTFGQCSTATIDEFRLRCRDRFPLATVFQEAVKEDQGDAAQRGNEE